MTQYVMYNMFFGGFSFNYKFLHELFKRFPPTTPEGQKLFSESHIDRLENDTESPFFGPYIFIHQEYDYPKNEARCIKNIETNKYYYLASHNTKHRANPDIIKFLFERVESMSEQEFNKRYDDIIESTHFESQRLSIVSENNTKKYTRQNWKNSEILVSQFLTFDISSPGSKICIAEVKPELTWRIHEYDGAESVIIKFDYYKLIQELVHELQINNIQPSSSCSELMEIGRAHV